jgi:hypothetical protein
LIIEPVIKKTLQDNFTLFPENEQLFLQLEGQFEDAIKNLEDAIKFTIKERPAIRSRIDTRSAIMLTRFEGSASNVLRDIQKTSSNMVEDIKMKRIVLQESLKNDNRIVESIMKDNRGQFKSGVTNQKFNRNGGSKFKKIETVFQIEN